MEEARNNGPRRTEEIDGAVSGVPPHMQNGISDRLGPGATTTRVDATADKRGSGSSADSTPTSTPQHRRRGPRGLFLPGRRSSEEDEEREALLGGRAGGRVSPGSDPGGGEGGGGGAEDEAAAGGPRDRWNLVYAVFYLLGMGTLLPWNFFISVNSFWDYKFRNVSLSEDSPGNGSNATASPAPPQQTELQKEFTSYLAIASNVPNAICVILNAVLGQRFDLKHRLFASMGVIITLFFVVTALARANSDSWQREFLEFILVLVVLINCSTAVFQGGIFGVAGKFPFRYMNSVMAGQAMGGIFPALVDIAVVSFRVPDQDVGFYCFVTATLVLVACFLGFSWARKTNFFKYYAKRGTEQQEQEEGRERVGEEEAPPTTPDSVSVREQQQQHRRRHSVLTVLRHNWQYCLSVYLVFAVTLAVFPAVTVLVEPMNPTHGDPWTTRYFTPVTCFLLFNVGDYAGRMLASYVGFPRGSGGKNPLALLLSLSRVAFVPAFMLCNAAPTRRHLPVVFGSDAAYVGFMAAFALTNGYLGNLCMLLGPKAFADSADQELAAMVMVACLVLGTGSGSFMSYPLVSAL